MVPNSFLRLFLILKASILRFNFSNLWVKKMLFESFSLVILATFTKGKSLFLLKNRLLPVRFFYFSNV